MEHLLTIALKSVAVLAVFVIVYHFLLRRLTFFNTNRAFLLLGILASITFPFIEITQTVYIERPVETALLSQPIMTPMAAVLETQPAVAPFDYAQLFLYLYVAVVLFFIGKMIVELTSLHRLIKSGKKVRKDGFVMVTLSRKLTPFSFFNYICYSAHDIDNADLPLIIDHEKVHAREWHSIDLLLSHLYRAVFWVNPLAWLLKRQIGENLEFIADAQAKSQHSESVNYERALLSSAASHMQPALANNFFTPFIKERITMLQKEASATWNAYKYALILPVMVVFIYSFNVVEEVEFVDVVIENQHQNENQNQIEVTLAPLAANSEDDIVSTDQKEQVTMENVDTVYEITPATSGRDLIKYADAISLRRSYNVKFSQINITKGRLDRFEIWTRFNPSKPYVKNMTVQSDENFLFLLRDLENQIQLNNDVKGETHIIKETGNTTIMEDWTYGDIKISNPESPKFAIEYVNFKNGIVTFRISKNTTNESLRDFKEQLKNAYNIDFKWSGLKRKNGVITAIKTQLDDNKGTVIKKAHKDNDGIDDICISGKISHEQNLWTMDNCLNQKSDYLFTNRFNQYRDTLSLATKSHAGQQNIVLENIDIVDEMEIDSFSYSRLYRSETKLDSLMEQLDNSYQEIRELEQQISNIDPSNAVIASFNNTKSKNQSTYAMVDPLIVINGEITDKKPSDITNSDNIESVNILKEQQATALYGEKGKNGVVIITTKAGTTIDFENNEVTGKRQEMMKERYKKQSSTKKLHDSIRNNLRNMMEERRSVVEKKRDSIMEQRNQLINQKKKQRNQMVNERKEQRVALIQQRKAIKEQRKKQGQLIGKLGTDQTYMITAFTRETILKAIGNDSSGYLYFNNSSYYFVVDENKKLNVFNRWGIYIDLDDPESIIKGTRKSKTISDSSMNVGDQQDRVGFSNRFKLKEFTREAIDNAIQDDTSGYLYYDNSTYFFVVDENKKLNVFNRWGIYIDLDDPDAIAKATGGSIHSESVTAIENKHSSSIVFFNGTANDKPFVIVNQEKLVFEKDQIRRNDTLFINQGDNKFLLKIAGKPSKRFYGIDPAGEVSNGKISHQYSSTYLYSDDNEFATNDMTKEGFDKLKSQLEKAGHSFDLLTHKMHSGKLKTLKFKINSSTHAMDANKGVKSLRINFKANDNTPMVIMESN